MNGGGAEREGDTESETGSRLRAIKPRARRGAPTHGPRDRDLAEVGRSTDCATQVPRLKSTLNKAIKLCFGNLVPSELHLDQFGTSVVA